MSIERALKVDGWMGDLELEYLARMASRSLMIAEIGSWKGRSTCALGANTEGIVIAVDTWQGSEEQGCIVNPTELYAEFIRNTYRLPIVPVRLPSVEAASRMNRAKFDLIFIDGKHDYESIRSDISMWTPLLSPSGILCGHDFTESWPGIQRAVQELVPRFRVVPDTSIWTTEGA